MLRQIIHAAPLLDPSIVVIQKFLSETLVDRDIGAQETCHMLQKLHLTISSCTFFSLNVNHKIYKCVSIDNPTSFTSTNFIDAYLSRPSALHSISLIEATRSWSYNAHRKKEKWKPRDPPAIVHVLPCYYLIPSIDTPLSFG